MRIKLLVKPLIFIGMFFLTSFLLRDSTFALPTFQVYIDGGVAGDIGDDEDTWFSFVNPFTLRVVGAYVSGAVNLEYVTLLVSVPEGERGTIFFSTPDEAPVLLATTGISPAVNANADIDILTNITGVDGYSEKNFFPKGVKFTNHYPVEEEISDFLLYDLSSFVAEDTTLYNYNADKGTITPVIKLQSWGEEKEYELTYKGSE